MAAVRIHETYSPEDTASDLIYRVGRLLRLRASQFLKSQGLDITPEQWGLLLKVTAHPGQTQGELADENLNDHPNITRMLDALAKRGLLERRPDPQDRRSFLIYATEKGKALQDRILPEIIEAKGRFYQGLNQTDIASLRDQLRLIEQNLLAESG
ncbi:MAG: MarR family transcriptional regulator [Desulfarculaceae bacterium]|jgi:DNA-binding MarR family transcriptional regulator